MQMLLLLPHPVHQYTCPIVTLHMYVPCVHIDLSNPKVKYSKVTHTKLNNCVPFNSHARVLLQSLKKFFLGQLEGIEIDGEKVDPPKTLPWYDLQF